MPACSADLPVIEVSVAVDRGVCLEIEERVPVGELAEEGPSSI